MKLAEEIERAEAQIRAIQLEVDYTVREYPIEVLVQKHTSHLAEGNNEIFVPEYQRDLVWDERRQAKFVESLLIGLPVPYLFVADVGNEDPDLAGRLEIIDGTQRIRTLARFLQGELTLSGLEKLPALNGFGYADLLTSRQRRFNRITLRMIELTEKADEETRRDMFDRINTGAVELNDMESRRGRFPGPFVELVKELASDERFKQLAPVSKAAEKRYEREELVTRFFAFREGYAQFGLPDVGKVVSDFVDHYTKRMNHTLETEGPEGAAQARLRAIWNAMIQFVEARFPHGFAKGPTAQSTPRVRFEAIAVGTALALAEEEEPAAAAQIQSWIAGEDFREETSSDAANNRSRVIGRIEFVRNKLLGR